MASDLTVPIYARLGNTEVQIGALDMPAQGDDTFVEVDSEKLRLARTVFRSFLPPTAADPGPVVTAMGGVERKHPNR